MQCFINCLAPPTGQGHTLPTPGKTHAAIVAAEARAAAASEQQQPAKPEALEAPLSELSIADIGKPSSPLGLKMKALQQQGNNGRPQAPSTRSGSTWSSKSSGGVSATFREPPLKASSEAAISSVFAGGRYMAATASKQQALAAAKAAEIHARAAEERAAKAMAEATKKGMAFAMHAPGGSALNPRRAPPNDYQRSKALEAARAAAAKARADGGVKPGVQQPHKPRHVSPANSSRRSTPVHSRSSSPANSHRGGMSSRPFKPTVPLDGAEPPSFMAPTKAAAFVPVRQSGDFMMGSGSDDPAIRIGPGEQRLLNVERMRWDEKYA